MLILPQNSLPPEVEVELEVRIRLGTRLLSQGYLSLDNEQGGVVRFQSAGIALQAGAYEVLRAIWPQAVDIDPDSRIIDNPQETPSGN